MVTVDCVPELIALDDHDRLPAVCDVGGGSRSCDSRDRGGAVCHEAMATTTTSCTSSQRASGSLFSYVDQGPFVPLLARSMNWLFPGSFAALRIPAIVAALGGCRVRSQSSRGNSVAAAPRRCSPLRHLARRSPSWVRLRRCPPTVLTPRCGCCCRGWSCAGSDPPRWFAARRRVGDSRGATGQDACPGLLDRDSRCRRMCGAKGIASPTCAVVERSGRAATAIPMLIWQARHGWPQAGMGAVVRGQTNGLSGSLTFIPRAVEMCGVLGAVLLVYGVWRLWRSPHLRPYRFLGFAFLLVVAVFAITGGRTSTAPVSTRQ